MNQRKRTDKQQRCERGGGGHSCAGIIPTQVRRSVTSHPLSSISRAPVDTVIHMLDASVSLSSRNGNAGEAEKVWVTC